MVLAPSIFLLSSSNERSTQATLRIVVGSKRPPINARLLQVIPYGALGRITSRHRLKLTTSWRNPSTKAGAKFTSKPQTSS